jgi:hypothetical protein
MYFLIGGDGREYGPYTADQIRDWVSQGRANAQSRIRRDAETTWQALGDLPEFAAIGGSAGAAPLGPPPLTPEVVAAEYLARGTYVDVGSCVSRGWVLVRDNPALTIGATTLVALVSFGLAMLPVVGILALIVNPVLLGGLAYMFTRRLRGESPTVGDAFAGFTLAFLQLGLAGLVSSILICIGLLLCLLPGIYLAVGYTFALPLVIDKKLDFWAAMEVSRRVVHQHWWTMFGLLLVAFLINILGILACFIGWFLAAPISIAAVMYAYEDLFGPRSAQVPAIAPTTQAM